MNEISSSNYRDFSYLLLVSYILKRFRLQDIMFHLFLCKNVLPRSLRKSDVNWHGGTPVEQLTSRYSPLSHPQPTRRRGAVSLEKNPRNLRLEFTKFRNSDPLCSAEFLAREKHDPPWTDRVYTEKGETNSSKRNWLEFLKFPRRDPWPSWLFFFFFTACTFVRAALAKKYLNYFAKVFGKCCLSFFSFPFFRFRFFFLFFFFLPDTGRCSFAGVAGRKERRNIEGDGRGRCFVQVSSDWFKLAARIIATLAAARCRREPESAAENDFAPGYTQVLCQVTLFLWISDERAVVYDRPSFTSIWILFLIPARDGTNVRRYTASGRWTRITRNFYLLLYVFW